MVSTQVRLPNLGGINSEEAVGHAAGRQGADIAEGAAGAGTGIWAKETDADVGWGCAWRCSVVPRAYCRTSGTLLVVRKLPLGERS